MAVKRIGKELQSMSQNPISGFTVKTVPDNPYRIDGFFTGPTGTPYEGGTFCFEIHFPTDYPFKPMKIHFLTKIYHPNIPEDSRVMVPELCEWTPKITITDVLKGIAKLITVPVAASADTVCLCCQGYSTNTAVQESTTKVKMNFFV